MSPSTVNILKDLIRTTRNLNTINDLSVLIDSLSDVIKLYTSSHPGTSDVMSLFFIIVFFIKESLDIHTSFLNKLFRSRLSVCVVFLRENNLTKLDTPFFSK